MPCKGDRKKFISCLANSQVVRGGNLKKFLESLAVFIFFGEWGLKGKFEKFPKIDLSPPA